MGRETRLVDAFVELADSLVVDFDPEELLQRLVEQSLGLLDVDAAGVLIGERGGGRLTAVAASSREMGQLEIFEIALEEGPSYDAYMAAEQVVATDLEAEADRWPIFHLRARDLGFVAAYGVPLRVRGDVLGAFNLFQCPDRPRLGEEELKVAQGFADVATLSLLQHRALSDEALRAEQLEHALRARVTIEQAKGRLAERHGISPTEAFARLRQHCRDHNVRVRDVAEAIADGRTDLSTEDD